MTETQKLLIIDDNEDDRMLYRRALRKSVDTAFLLVESDDGEKGFERISEVEPACILLDYSLPGRNGIEVLKRIRANHPFVPVVMLTGQGNENVAVAAMREGAQNYISKSAITPETLEHVIHMAIEHCQLQKRIEDQRNSLEVFTRALAHDLKEPVRTIRSFTEMIMQYETFSPKAGEYFEHIQKAADRMAMLIDTVFIYTRLEDPGQIAKENFNMAMVLKEVKENADLLIHEHKATVTSGFLPDVYASRIQMIQLLQNLICNAIHHSENRVAVHVEAQEGEENWLFSVRDDGPGIDGCHLQKIFEPFKRLRPGHQQGAGLGLAICKKIIESYGGRIWCVSKPGEGTVFYFTLPKSSAKPASLPANIQTALPEKKNNAASNGLASVLLVDDSHADVEITRFRLLERSGLNCDLLVARDGEEALATLKLRAAQHQSIDLVLLDINMPEMDGFELLEKIRADQALQSVAVVMCSGSLYDKDMARAYALGATGYITKPIEFTKLKSVIEATPTMVLKREERGFSLLRAA